MFVAVYLKQGCHAHAPSCFLRPLISPSMVIETKGSCSRTSTFWWERSLDYFPTPKDKHSCSGPVETLEQLFSQLDNR